MSALVVQIFGQPPAMFTEAFTVGRLNSPRMICPLALDDEYVTSPHARFFPDGSAWFVEDLGSTNGTYLNGSFQRVYGPQLLRQGDKIRIGHTTLTVVPT